MCNQKIIVQLLAAFSLLGLYGCDAPVSVPSTGTGGGESSGEVSPTYPEVLTAWIINTSEQAAHIVNGGAGGASTTKALVNVQSVASDEAQYVNVKTTGVPDYEFNITQDQVDWLNARPKAVTDFATAGATNASAGDLISFGEDINYNSSTAADRCQVSQGYGYWPPGPGCPTNKNKDKNLPLQPAVNAGSDCETALGALGYAINGVSMYGWGDGMSVKNVMGSWKADPAGGAYQTLAPVAEVYDVDLCGGHAANGDYHHHFYSQCWEDVTDENGVGHSEIFGFAADGYPVYGPYHNTGVRAKSCWVVRDFSSASASGCGVNNKRTCVLTDKYDIDGGVVALSGPSEYGPDVGLTYTSLSGNSFTASAGAFFEDYGFDPDCPSQGDEYLDEFNGHDHDGLGYHYHVTIDASGNPQFPYIIGPKFKGNLPSSKSITTCS